MTPEQLEEASADFLEQESLREKQAERLEQELIGVHNQYVEQINILRIPPYRVVYKDIYGEYALYTEKLSSYIRNKKYGN